MDTCAVIRYCLLHKVSRKPEILQPPHPASTAALDRETGLPDFRGDSLEAPGDGKAKTIPHGRGRLAGPFGAVGPLHARGGARFASEEAFEVLWSGSD